MDYDTKDFIEAQLGSYHAFYTLMRSRANLGYLRTDNESWQRLTPYIILGRYKSDEFGGCHRLNRALFTDADRTAMSAVMNEEEFLSFFEKNIQPRIKKSYWSSLEGTSGLAPGFPLPEPHLICAKCGGTWEINTCHDIDAEGDFEEIDLSSFAGRTLFWVQAKLEARTDALRRFGHPITVRNPQWSDPRAADDEYADPEELGWREVTLDHVVQPGDKTSMFRYRFYHGPCFRQLSIDRSGERATEYAEDFKQILEETGFEDVQVIRTALPEHLRRWFATDLDEGESIDELAEAFMYYRVQTRQGSFGVAYAAYPMLDLEGSGVSLHELEPELAAEAPPDFPPITGLSGPEQLLKLWQLLVKNQSKK